MSVNDEISELFENLARLMELRGENTFKVIAFQKVSRLIGESSLDLRKCMEEGTICEIQGVGKSSQQIIEEYLRTGKSTALAELSEGVPAGLIPMLKISGLGPKTVGLFWKERGITSIDELKSAIETGKLADLKGIGEKKIESIKQGLAMLAQAGHRMGIVDALPIAQDLVRQLREIKTVKSAEIAGSLRRRRETVGDVDLICSLKDGAAGQAVSDTFVKFPAVQRILGQGPTKASVITTSGLQVDLRIVPPENFGAALLYFTGSKEHGVKIRGLALQKEMTLNEWGLYKLAGFDKAEKKIGEPPAVKPLASKTESDVYKKLGMSYVEPELREDRGEVEAALAGKLPKLIDLADIHGDLHSHTTASDGKATIEQMAEAAIAKGYQFLGITDHSKSQVIANGLSADRLLTHA